MRVRSQPVEYDVFHLESKDQLSQLNTFMNERGWLMQIQEWQDGGFFRPEKYLRSNYFDVYFSIGQYILIAVVDRPGYEIPYVMVRDTLKGYDTVA